MNNNFLTQVSTFIKIAMDTTDSLQQKLFEQTKLATINEFEREKYRVALTKAADALYDSDFLGSEIEKKTFIKKATEDPVFVVRTLEKIAEASDVAQIGKPAKMKSAPKSAEYDPVMEAAFGMESARGIIDE